MSETPDMTTERVDGNEPRHDARHDDAQPDEIGRDDAQPDEQVHDGSDAGTDAEEGAARDDADAGGSSAGESAADQGAAGEPPAEEAEEAAEEQDTRESDDDEPDTGGAGAGDAESQGHPAAHAAEQQPSDDDAADPTTDTREQVEAAPAPASRRAPRSRRATRPTSAPEHEKAGGTTESRLDVLAELRASTQRAPADASAASSDAAAALGSIVFEPPTRRSEASSAERADIRGARDGGEAPNAGDAAVGEADTDNGPRLPVTALLFQAPDLTSAASRGRRAQAPAGPPAFGFAQDEAEADGTVEEAPSREPGRRRSEAPAAAETSSVDEGADAGDEDQADESDDEASSTSASGQRRRRRRGGRGRRNRGVGGQGDENDKDDDDEDEDESASDAQAAAEDGGAQDDAPEADADSGQPRQGGQGRGQRRRGGSGGRGQRDKGADAPVEDTPDESADAESGPAGDGEAAGGESGSSSSRRRRRRRRGSRSEGGDAPSTLSSRNDEVTALKGSTRLEAKRQRRREGRDAGRRRTVVTEAEFLARRESVDRSMVVRERDGRTQIAILEDDVLVEHFVARRTQTSMVGNVYLGRVQNVLPSMEAAFVDLGKGRNAVLYAGEVNWDAAGMEGQPRRIEQALSSGDSVMVQVTKDPIGHKGARLTSQITLAGRYLVLVPSGGMTGISRKLPDTERARLKKLLREIVPDGAGVIVRTAAEGASEEELRLDVARLRVQWAEIERKAKSAPAPSLLHGEPDLAIRVVRDVFNEDFASVTIAGDDAWDAIAGYIESIAPDLAPRLHRWTAAEDVFHAHRIDEQLTKALDRKVWLPSGGSLVIDRTEAMTVVDVNTGKFVGAGGTLEETVTRNNLEAAEEIVRQLRLRDIGGIIVIDFIDMVLESNRDLVLRRLVECLGRDRTRHQVAEVTSLGLVQMTRKRVGQGLHEAFTEPCEACGGRGHLVRSEPVEKASRPAETAPEEGGRSGSRRRGRRGSEASAGAAAASGSRRSTPATPSDGAAREAVKATLATIAAAAAHAHDENEPGEQPDPALAGIAAASAEATEDSEILIDFDRIRSDEADSELERADRPEDGGSADSVAQGDRGRADAVQDGQPDGADQPEHADPAGSSGPGGEGDASEPDDAPAQPEAEPAGANDAPGERADSEQTQAEPAEADDVPGERADGEQTQGELAEGENTKGERADGEQTQGAPAADEPALS